MNSPPEVYLAVDCESTSTNDVLQHNFIWLDVPEQNHFCTVCNEVFPDLINLQRHYADHIVNKAFKCNKCSEVFTSDEELEKHEATHYADHIVNKAFNCNECSKVFSSDEILEKHKTTHWPIYSCDKCFKHCFTETALKLHKKRCYDPDYNATKLKCNECGMSFRHEMEFKRHSESHFLPYRCEDCNLAFLSQKKLSVHLLKSHRTSVSLTTCTADNNVTTKVYKEGGVKIRNLFFKCQLCTLCFSNRFLLNNHLNSHSSKNIVCNGCLMTFATRAQLYVHEKSHVIQHTEEENFTCWLCKELFNTKTDLFSHLNTHEQVESYGCPLCAERFFFAFVLNVHIETHTKQGTCNVCAFVFLSDKQLFEHEKTHLKKSVIGGFDKYPCSLCTTDFTDQESLIEHYNSSHISKKRSYYCEECHKSFFFSFMLRNHKFSHPTNKRFQCHLCTDCLHNAVEFAKHLRAHWNERKHVCSKCQTDFDSKENLRNHIRMKHCENRFQCEDCSTKFFTEEKLERHYHIQHWRERNIDKSYKCDECEKSFTQLRYLKNHKTSHLEGRVTKYTCYLCQSAFPKHSHLKRHQLAKHPEAEDKYICEICGLITKHQSSFTRHLKIHNNQRCHKCHHCDKKFYDISHLVAHHNYVHKGLEIKNFTCYCKYCKKGFLTNWGLREHLRKFHFVSITHDGDSFVSFDSNTVNDCDATEHLESEIIKYEITEENLCNSNTVDDCDAAEHAESEMIKYELIEKNPCEESKVILYEGNSI